MPRTPARKQKKIDTYLDLVTRFPLRRLRSDQEHREALAIYDRLTREETKDQGTLDYLDMLVDVITDYEQKAGHRLDTSNVTAADVVRHLMEERNLSVRALAQSIEMSQGTLNDMLHGKRDWSKSTIIKLCRFFHLQADLFLR